MLKVTFSQTQNFKISRFQDFKVCEDEMVAAISAYRSQKNRTFNKHKRSQAGPKSNCRNCGYQHEKGKCPAYGQSCIKCGKLNHFARVCESVKGRADKVSSAVIISSVKSDEKLDSLPRLPVVIGTGFVKHPQVISLIPDTGAEVTVAGPGHLSKLGIKKEYLLPSNHDLTHVGGGKINVFGKCKLAVEYNGNKVVEDIYFIEGITKIFLSLHACKRLKIVSDCFPFSKRKGLDTNKKELNNVAHAHTVKATERIKSESMDKNITDNDGATSKVTIPYAPTEENIDKLKEWLIDRFSDTVFNDSRKPFPAMDCKPHHIHIKDNAPPFAVHSPIPIAHHWRNDVKELLDKYVETGIVTRVEVGEPVDWVHQNDSGN